MLIVEYLYRDANNYKDFRRLLLNGTLTKLEIEEIRAKLDEQLYFIPAQVGLPPADRLQRQFGYDYEADHPWHELTRIEVVGVNGVNLEEEETEEMTAPELLEAFRAVEFWYAEG